MVDKSGIAARDVVTQLEQDKAKFTFRSGWRYSGNGESMELQVAIQREDALSVQNWQDYHPMTAITIAQMQALMSAAGFSVTILERDYSMLKEWDGNSYNVIMVGQKPHID
jgi:hypothetical protein